MNTAVKTHQPCPSCGSSDALSEYDDGHSFCFSCSEYFPSNGDLNNDSNGTFYYQSMPEWRGIYSQSFSRYSIRGKCRSGSGEILEVEFPYPSGGRKIRRYNRKAFYSIGTVKGLFGRDIFPAGSNNSIIITEGELDAISCWQASRLPSVSVRSASSGSKECADDLAYLGSFSRIYLAFDSDGPGQELLKSVARMFDYNRVYRVSFAPYKDANELLTKGGQNELATVIKNARRYLPETIVSSFSDFKNILDTNPSEGIPYPFPTLNSMTYGMRKGESVLITAQEGVGKTELMHALEYQLLKQTTYPVGAIYLEEPKKRHLQAIAGLHLRRPVHIPDEGFSNDEVYRALTEAIGSDERLLLYSHFGSDSADSLIDAIRYMVSACGAGAVLLDHITMGVSGLQGVDDERRQLDYLSTRLEMLVKELNFILIIVSHVNDFGQTRGSRYISKVADIRIDLSRDLNSIDDLIRNTTMVTISKNRFCGKTGPAGKLLFDAKTYTYSELQEADNDNQEVEQLIKLRTTEGTEVVGRPVLLAV